MRISLQTCLLFCLLALAPFTSRADNPEWIWYDNKGKAIQPDEVCYLRKVFHVDAKPSKAVLSIAADDEATVYLNGKQVARVKGYEESTYEDITSQIRKGE